MHACCSCIIATEIYVDAPRRPDGNVLAVPCLTYMYYHFDDWAMCEILQTVRTRFISAVVHAACDELAVGTVRYFRRCLQRSAVIALVAQISHSRSVHRIGHWLMALSTV